MYSEAFVEDAMRQYLGAQEMAGVLEEAMHVSPVTLSDLATRKLLTEASKSWHFPASRQ